MSLRTFGANTWNTLPESCSMPEYLKSTASLLKFKKSLKRGQDQNTNAAYANENETSSYTWYLLCTTFCKDEFRALSSFWGGAIFENS